MSLRFLAVLSLLLASCGTVAIHDKNATNLAAAVDHMNAGRYADAQTNARAVLLNTGEVANDYALQRFYASYLLNQVHLAAAFNGPFLTENEVSWRGEVRAKPSRNAHLVASVYHGSHGIDAFGAANGKPAVVDGVDLLPPSLAGIDAQSALRAIEVSMLAVYSRLQYDLQVARILDDVQPGQKLGPFEAMLDQCQVAEHMRPWLYWSVFERKQEADPAAAFKFGVRTIETAAAEGAEFPTPYIDELASWMLDNPSYTFTCPSCFDRLEEPRRSFCILCGEGALLEFIPEPRSASKSVDGSE